MNNEPKRPPRSRWGCLGRVMLLALVVSLLFNAAMYVRYRDYFSAEDGPQERFHSGDRTAKDKIALINVTGTIMPPFTSRIIQAIDRAKEDADVKAVVLVVDSPGGLVADSHQIYHRLELLRETNKPIVVAMQSLAASGGYYVAMGAGPEGRIFAEPTTWTGSIGVIIPRFEVKELAEKIGFEAVPLKTGEFKDALSPFRDLTERERELWDGILDDSFQRFIDVIADNRADLDEAKVRELATGRIFTSNDAIKNGLVDEIGYQEDAINYVKKQAGLTEARVVSYDHPVTVVELLLGSSDAKPVESALGALLESTVPRSMYFYGAWPVGLSSWSAGAR